jgi:ribonuclease P protein component
MVKSLLFSRQLRLHKQAQFAQIFENKERKTKKMRNLYFTLLYQNNELNHPRLGVIVGKNNVKKATKRNFLRRIVKESFRIQQQELPPLDCVVLIYKDAANLDRTIWRQVLDQQWQQLIASSAK